MNSTSSFQLLLYITTIIMHYNVQLALAQVVGWKIEIETSSICVRTICRRRFFLQAPTGEEATGQFPFCFFGML